ncbi:SEED MATURATION PROTEIN 1 [Diospyros lotus]|uniref:SEED MATURATION PROTEIN 1 n=1 Tax=Diospyros lotus TaxID=55363 RepID=UPI00225205BD|nr:SEED MATURATION PROTEIN 1 [Diospyros lotus]
MAKSKDDIKYGTAQAKLSEDETLRVAYKAGTPLEAGKIAESEPVDFFSSAHNISSQKPRDDRSQLRGGSADTGGGNSTSATNS